ncbi:MAG: serine protease [Planctomycetia bacterium]
MRRTSPVARIIVPVFASSVLLVACQQAAFAQGAARGWGVFGNPTTRWSPDAVSDYLLTGQTPRPAVVRIVAPEQGGTSLGSGVLVDVNRTQGLVLTNWHVIRDSRAAVLVQFPDGFQSAGTVIRWDEAWDLAAIVVWRPPAMPVPIAAAPPVPGEQLTIAGFGRGTYREESGPCTEYLSPGAGYPKEFVELAATARQGDSGGPIFNADGKLAGVLFGQNDGRTLGSCSTRVRAFLATAGSSGFTPTPMGQFSNARPIDHGQGGADTPVIRTAAAAIGRPQAGSMPPQSGVAGDAGVGQTVIPVADHNAMNVDDAGGLQSTWPPLQPAESRDIWEILDVRTNGPALLSTAGGMALLVLGLRTVLGGRRRPPPPNAGGPW